MFYYNLISAICWLKYRISIISIANLWLTYPTMEWMEGGAVPISDGMSRKYSLSNRKQSDFYGSPTACPQDSIFKTTDK